ncbi:MAG: biopolymer transporter ExbD [Pseudomonadota bacterium]
MSVRSRPRPRATRRKPEPTIALINVVFLMLIFFLVAGTVAPPLDPDLTLATAEDLEGRAPPDALVLHADGTTTFRGTDLDPAAYVAQLTAEADAGAGEQASAGAGDAGAAGPLAARLVPDRDVPAIRLMEVTLELRAAGAAQVMVVAERGLQ